MKIKTIILCIAFVAYGSIIINTAGAQEANAVRTQEAVAQGQREQAVGLAQKAIALDASGREALGASLLTSTLQGTPEAPIKNARFIVENRGAAFYTYVSGTITFYKEGGVRCGEGLFALNTLAPGEAAETDAPGLRLECAPSSWRIVATNLLTRSSDAAKLAEPETPAPVAPAPPVTPSSLYLTVDGRLYEVPLNSTLDIPVRRRRIKITLSDRP